MSADPFHLNRPVHLARRDAFYEKAIVCIRRLPAQKQLSEQRKTAEEALYLMKEARRHAEAANLSDKTSAQNRLFVAFMDTVVDNTLSITRMIRRQLEASAPDNPLDGFTGTPGSSAKMENHYHRCATVILKGLLTVLQQAEKPFHDLCQTSLAKMTLADKARYEKARKHFEVQADQEAEKAAGKAS